MESQTEFYRAFTLSRQEAGLGARCPICGGCVRYGLEPGKTTFEHCGHKELAPKDVNDLPCRLLQRGLPEMDPRYALVFTADLEGNDWEADSNAASFNPARMDVPWF